MPSDYDEAARHFDREQVPGDMENQAQIQDYLEREYSRDTVPQGLIDEIAPRIEERRAGRGGGEVDLAGGEVFFDPDAGQYRDSDTGQFTSGPEG